MQSEILAEQSVWRILAKYFIHGIGFSVLGTILTVAWVLGLLVLVMLGSFIGLIIGLAVLVLIIGFANAVITTELWFPVKSGLWDTFLHGFVLLAILVIVDGLIVTLPSIVFPSLGTTIITFIVSSFINGFICKKVAEWWEEE
ncbi:MAG: hypothetical protein JSV05_02640 [Candidatus Bathyarchaeota archaeon]|nr:MAG: hypothetical protein JSV05_02640 [Candidatus Bathyarchaeota archaeon]